MQNFDPKEIMATLDTLCQRVETIATALAPFLPAPVGTAINDVEAIAKDVQKLRDFIVTEYPQLQAVIGTAGVGATQAAGIIAEDLQNVEAQRVGTFKTLPETPATASEHPEIAGDGAATTQRPEAQPNPDLGGQS